MFKKFFVTTIIALFVSHPVFASNAPKNWTFEPSEAVQVPDDIPFFDEAAEKHYLEEYEGKTLLIVFWATWCGACVQEMTDLDILQKDFRKLPFTIIPISEDDQGIKAVEKFYALYEISHLPILHDYRNQLFKAFSVVGMPTSFIVSPEGVNIGSFKGVVNWHDDNVRKILLSHITGNPTEPKNSYKSKSLNQIIQPQKPKEAKSNEQSKKNEE
ncbi:MAG: TlpA disulfide reductase family protein [Pseudomonadota bacterium]